MTKRDILTEVLVEIGVLDPGDTMDSRLSVTVGHVFDRTLDSWNAEQRAVYASVKQTFTLTPDLSPHTIGASGGTWTTTQRPVAIDAANLVLSGSEDVRRPIRIRDAQWYAGLSVPDLSTSVPTDLYYEPDWPLGKCFFHPVPSEARDVDLWSRMVLSALSLDDAFDLPPGYREAIVLTVAEGCAGPYAVAISELTVRNAGLARARIFGANTPVPRLATRDAGMPRGSRGRTFNYLDRTF